MNHDHLHFALRRQPFPHAFGVVNKEVTWLRRLWYLLSNPFVYVFTGRIRW